MTSVLDDCNAVWVGRLVCHPEQADDCHPDDYWCHPGVCLHLPTRFQLVPK